jgi:hypothetical protein
VETGLAGRSAPVSGGSKGIGKVALHAGRLGIVPFYFTALLCLENVFRKNAAQLHPHQGHSQDQTSWIHRSGRSFEPAPQRQLFVSCEISSIELSLNQGMLNTHRIGTVGNSLLASCQVHLTRASKVGRGDSAAAGSCAPSKPG